MKNYQAFILILFLLSSCSQQQFAFRKKIAVTNANNVVMQYQPKSDTIQLATATASSQITYTEPTSFIQQQNELITENPSVLPDDTIRKKYKFDEDKRQNNPDLGSDLKNGNFNYNEKADKDALVGFIFSIASWLLLPFFAIPGLIYSIRGLKSFKRKGLAIAGVIISSLVLLFLILLIALFFVLISTFGP
jgi:hypothetical protein